MKEIVRRNLKEDYSLLVDVEGCLLHLKRTEKLNAVTYVYISEMIDKLKCVEHNLLQMMIKCLEDDQTLYDLFLDKTN